MRLVFYKPGVRRRQALQRKRAYPTRIKREENRDDSPRTGEERLNLHQLSSREEIHEKMIGGGEDHQY